jgi:hypothetical protein
MLGSCLAYSSTLKTEATRSSDKSVDFQWTTRRYITEDNRLARLGHVKRRRHAVSASFTEHGNTLHKQMVEADPVSSNHYYPSLRPITSLLGYITTRPLPGSSNHASFRPPTAFTPSPSEKGPDVQSELPRQWCPPYYNKMAAART